MVDQHYRSSERSKAGKFCLQQVARYFLFSMTSWLTSDNVINKKHIERFIGNMLSFVRIILSFRLSEIFCLQNFLGAFLINWFNDNGHYSLCDVFNISTPFFSLNSFLFSVEKN